MKYKVAFSGYAYVEAEREQEAEDKYFDDQYGYREEQVDEVEEVDKFIVVLQKSRATQKGSPVFYLRRLRSTTVTGSP